MKNKGFTLLEILLVIAVISILAGIVILAINPSKQLAEARNSERHSDTRTLLDALYQYSIDHNGNLPKEIDTSLRMIGTDSSGCEVECGNSGGSSLSDFTDGEQSEFDQGDYTDTQWNGTNEWLELNSTGQSNGSGFFTSRIFDAESSTSWNSISWNPQQPYYKELPNNSQTENDYNTGNANMSGNVLLMHLNETSGTIRDDSGNGNNGTNYGATYSASGTFFTSLNFNGSSDYVEIPNSSELNPTNTISLEAWVKWDIDPSTGNSWAQIINKFGENQYQIQHSTNNAGFEFALNTTSGRTWVISNTSPTQNTWHHVVGTYDGTTMSIYVDGNLENTTSHSGNIPSSSSELLLGKHLNFNRHFEGSIDEVAIYSRVLSPGEIEDRYKRGAQRIKFQVRSCDDLACNTESFIGPDGTSNSYYSELINATPELPDLTIMNLPDNQYFQYMATLETDNSNHTPELNSVVINTNNVTSGGESTQETCIDLNSYLVSDYITDIPQDPLDGSSGKTYYAVRSTGTNRLEVISCGAELEKDIRTRR